MYTETFLKKFSTVRADECWLWHGSIDMAGYARLRPKGGVNLLAHRFSYEFYKGRIPDGLVIDHLCRVRHCVNPHHLEAVTFAENIRRGLPYPTYEIKGQSFQKKKINLHRTAQEKVDSNREAVKRWNDKHPGESKRRAKEWARKNRDRIRDKVRAYMRNYMKVYRQKRRNVLDKSIENTYT